MTDKQTVSGIVEAALYVEDLDRSIKFYQDLFDFQKEIYGDLICVLRVPGRQALILFPKRIASEVSGPATPAGAVEGAIPPHGGNGRLHVAFAIAASELEWWERRLSDRNIAVAGRVRWKRGGISLFFRDPDEHLVELITPGLWSFY